jgi:hypothetical protein
MHIYVFLMHISFIYICISERNKSNISIFRNVYNWRVKETERMVAMVNELTKLGMYRYVYVYRYVFEYIYKYVYIHVYSMVAMVNELTKLGMYR